MVASGTRKQPSLGELGGAGAREGGSRSRGFWPPGSELSLQRDPGPIRPFHSLQQGSSTGPVHPTPSFSTSVPPV